MTTVLLETSGLTRADVTDALSGDGIVTLVGGGSPGALAERVHSVAPDVVIIEAEGDEPPSSVLPSVDLRAWPPVIVLVARADTNWALAALRSGVRAVLPRDSQDLAAAIAAVAAGFIVLHPDAAESIVRASGASATLPGKRQALSAREIEVLRMIAEGHANKVIAARMGISEHTVKFHVGSIFAKLHAGSRTEAVTLGARQGLVML